MNSADPMFKLRDAGSYDAVVDYFDHYTEMFSAHVPPELISMAGIASGATVLDVGTGTGVVARPVARHVGPTGRVVGIDLSDGMLATARKKAAAAGLADRIDFMLMDAESLEFRDGAFDAVVSLYALRHFPDPGKALGEIYRVLRPGGRLAVAVGSPPPLLSPHAVKAVARRLGSTWRRARGRELSACGFLDELVARHVPAGPGHDQTAWGAHNHAYREPVTNLVRQAGFTNIRSAWTGQYSIIDTAEDFWRLQMTFSSLSRKRIQDADKATVEKLRAIFMDRCENVLRRHGRLVYQTGAAIVAGCKSASDST